MSQSLFTWSDGFLPPADEGFSGPFFEPDDLVDGMDFSFDLLTSLGFTPLDTLQGPLEHVAHNDEVEEQPHQVPFEVHQGDSHNSSHTEQANPSAQPETIEDERSSRKSRGARAKALDWEAQRDTVKLLYMDQDLSLESTKRQMATRGFVASTRSFRDKIKEWKMEKNLTAANASFMRSRAAQRQAELNKPTLFKLRGRPVQEHKYEGADLVAASQGIAMPIDTPSAISYETPRDPSNAGPYTPLPMTHSTPIPDTDTEDQPTKDRAFQPIKLMWQGLSVNELIAMGDKARSLPVDGDNEEFLEPVLKSLNGLESLLTLDHTITLAALDEFLSTARKRKLVERAEIFLKKFLDKAIRDFGDTHPSSLRLLGMLGNWLFDQDEVRFAESEIVLRRQLEAVGRSINLSAEDKFKRSIEALGRLLEIATHNKDELKMRDLMETWITQASDLGDDYQFRLMSAKSNFGCYYRRYLEKLRGPAMCKWPKEMYLGSTALYRVVETHLQDFVSWCRSRERNQFPVEMLHALGHLQSMYSREEELEKLAVICGIAKQFLPRVEKEGSVSKRVLLHAKMQLVDSFKKLVVSDEERVLALQTKHDVDTSTEFGSQSLQSFRCTLDCAEVVSSRDDNDTAIQLFQEAQGKGLALLRSDFLKDGERTDTEYDVSFCERELSKLQVEIDLTDEV